MSKENSKVRRYPPEGIKALKNIGFASPDSNIIDAPFEVLVVFTKKDRYGNQRTWVPIVIHDKEKDLSAMFEGCVLAGFEKSPVRDDMGIDESLLGTWNTGSMEPFFQEPA
ncbi:MAG TPA: hypothetical protein VMV77_10370 [Bacteroidales bacterium]|nr:hypothetical protein [Bacteroidales bacterium]